jgi:hypothetical protein
MSEDKWLTPQALVDHLVDDLGADLVDAALLAEYLEWEAQRQLGAGVERTISVSPERFKAWLEGDR